MPAETRHGSPLDMQLPDGGRVTVSVDLGGDLWDEDDLEVVTEAVEVEVAAALVTAGDGESDVERAVTAVVEAYGFTASRQRIRRITVR
jgi:hypothetical protein